MDSNLVAVVGLIFVALIFDYINGFHDAANSIATVVSTRVLSPGKAVIWAAVFNFIAAFTFGTAVAKTVGAGLVDIHIVSFTVIFAGLIGAIVWDLITWYYGLPTSSSHALIGGYAGAAVAKAGWGAIIASGWTKTLIFIVLAPLMGMGLGFVIMLVTMWLLHGVPPVASIAGSDGCSYFQPLRTASHGGNDAQKTMGIIAGALVAWISSARQRHHADSFVGDPLRTRGDCSRNLSGGWRIIHTMGSKITKLQPVGGFAAGNGWGDFALYRDASRYSRQHHTHDHRRDYRRWFD
jgi:PiT family inorganic phosphate transporter